MRSQYFLAICFSFQCLLVRAQRPKVQEDPIRDPALIPITPQNPVGADPPKANVPGALAVGREPYISPSTEKTDLSEIGKQLSELIDKIVSAFDYKTSTSTSTDNTGSSTTITATITDNHAFPTAASACADAGNYYDLCSSSFANFTTLPRTQQAGCLCNVYSDSNFNDLMNRCYSYLAPANQTQSQTQTQLASYATAVASGTALCASTQATTLTTAAPAPPPPTPTPTTSAASRMVGQARCAVAFAFVVVSLSYALL